MSLEGKNILITGGGVRLGRQSAISLARAGANIMLHYGSSISGAEETAEKSDLLAAKSGCFKPTFLISLLLPN